MKKVLQVCTLLMSGAGWWCPAVSAGEFELPLENVSLMVSFQAINPAQEKQLTVQLQQQLQIGIEKLNAIAAAEFSAAKKSPDSDLHQRCMQWEYQSQSAFSCRLGDLEAQWQQARISNELPDRAQLRQLAGQLRRDDRVALAPGIYWHAWILDQFIIQLGLGESGLDELKVAEKPRVNEQYQNALKSLRLRIGSQQRCWSKDAIAVDLCKPVFNETNNTFEKISVAQFAATASALSIIDQQDVSFTQKIGPYRLSTIINPRDGWPAEFAPSVIVTAADSFTATAVAQTLVVKPPVKGIAWANSLAGVAALVVDEHGRVFATSNWYQYIEKNKAYGFWKNKIPFVIDYEIPNQSVAEYRKPYLALWISDSTAKPVKHLRLLGDNSRWLRELKLWWRRQGRLDDGLVDAISGATEKPASYHLEWDGRDDFGNPLAQGSYEFHIEVAREHGDHELVSIPFTLSDQRFQVQAKGKTELGKVSLSFNPGP
ncbi:MAG: hypothetical protein B0W54_08480 [Cellvibrio sp. 79]|nr:MAG: hypothetical protein B0W54_08480 [Cellvibrio sp. 79]